MSKTELYIQTIRGGNNVFLRTQDSKLFSVREITYMISNQYYAAKALTEIYINNHELLREDVTIPNILKILKSCKEVSFDFDKSIIDNKAVCEINIH